MVENVYNTLISHTNSHDIRGRSTLKDVQRDFRNGPVHESSVDSVDGFDLICSLTSTNNMSVNSKSVSKSLNKDVKTDAKSGSMDAETNTVDISAERSALSKQRQHSIENNKATILDTSYKFAKNSRKFRFGSRISEVISCMENGDAFTGINDI